MVPRGDTSDVTGARVGLSGVTAASLGLLLGACFPIGIAEEYRDGHVHIYNRTLAVISFDHGWVPICSMGSYRLPDWGPPSLSPPPGAVRVSIDPGVPADFRGVVSVVVSETGTETMRGDPDDRQLAKCAGLPPH